MKINKYKLWIGEFNLIKDDNNAIVGVDFNTFVMSKSLQKSLNIEYK
jgi:hypothetical protein